MNIIPFLKSDLVSRLVSDHETIRLKQQQASYNLFTISSYNSYLENFHSDIIASLLNPEAPHQQFNVFLFLFIDYLNKFHDLEIDKEEFTDVEVTREKGRIDIWIKDTISRKSIIIENKINNAADMDDQIDRYHEYAETDNNYPVEVIVYLTIDGTKKAPPAGRLINPLIKNVEAFTDNAHDLLNGWLEPCLKVAGNPDSFSFLYQYIKLIKHLASRSMATNTMEELYNFISEENGFKTLDTIVEMYAGLTTFRADKFSKDILDYAPFKRQIRYKPWYLLYDFYLYNDHRLKLDVWFVENGGAEVVFWNVSTEGQNGRMVLTEKLNAISMIGEFTDEVGFNSNGYSKHFIIGGQYKTMSEVDQTLNIFVKELMKKLKQA
nr:PD-(D/E)XK nuclease family protein [Mucilaginibacter sp. L294]